jgi:hypothetical protein
VAILSVGVSCERLDEGGGEGVDGDVEKSESREGDEETSLR